MLRDSYLTRALGLGVPQAGRRKGFGSQNTDISEGPDEINTRLDQLDDRLQDVENKTNGGDGTSGSNGADGLNKRVTDIETRLANAQVQCNEDGTVSVTI